MATEPYPYPNPCPCQCGFTIVKGYQVTVCDSKSARRQCDRALGEPGGRARRPKAAVRPRYKADERQPSPGRTRWPRARGQRPPASALKRADPPYPQQPASANASRRRPALRALVAPACLLLSAARAPASKGGKFSHGTPHSAGSGFTARSARRRCRTLPGARCGVFASRESRSMHHTRDKPRILFVTSLHSKVCRFGATSVRSGGGRGRRARAGRRRATGCGARSDVADTQQALLSRLRAAAV
jgi:hypothetical protein